MSEKNIDNIMTRQIKEEDINELIDLFITIDYETHNMLYAPGERELYIEKQKQQIINIKNDVKSNIWVAVNSKQNLIGYLLVIGNTLIKIKHSAYIVIGIQQKYTHKGIGTKLFNSLFVWAQENNLHRLELNVRANNKKAVDCYSKMGFVKEGIKKDSIYYSSEYEDEICMAKIF